MEKENSKSSLNEFIHSPLPYKGLDKAIFLIRMMVGCVFLSEGIQKILFSESLGVGRFIKIGIPAPRLWLPSSVLLK